MRSPSEKLTAQQLVMVRHLANGMTLHDIAIAMNCSDANVAKHLGIARRKTATKTLPHLVSIVIARGQLVWSPEYASRVIGDINAEIESAPSRELPAGGA
jgi:DNA-binding CsgD family transcriptional regulator